MKINLGMDTNRSKDQACPPPPNAAAAGWFCHAERRRYTPAYIGVRRAFSDFKIILSSFEDIIISVTDSD